MSKGPSLRQHQIRDFVNATADWWRRLLAPPMKQKAKKERSKK